MTMPVLHDDFAARAAAHALGALDADERREFEAHLPTCEACRREVARYRETAALLAAASPAVALPAALRERVLAAARTTPQGAGARVIGAIPRRPTLAWLAAAAAIVVAVGIGALWRRESGLRQDAESARLRLAQALATSDARLAERDAMIGALLEPHVRSASLAATGQGPSMELFWNRDRRLVILATANLRTAPTGRTYQLWGIVPGRAPRSLGTFAGDASGRSVVMLPVPADLDMQLAAVTEEPAGGSPQPTSAPFVAGSVRER